MSKANLNVMENKKTQRITIRLSKKQDTVLRKKANELGLSLSKFMLKSVLGKGVVFNASLVLNQINKLESNDGKLENNLNQLVKKINSNIVLDNEERQELRNLLSLVAQKREVLAKNIQEFYRILTV